MGDDQKKTIMKLLEHYLIEKKQELNTLINLIDLSSIKYNNLEPSLILSYLDKINLLKLCGFSNKIKWQLIYRASSHGFYGQNFHEKCDGIKPTLTIVQTNEGCVFGGFTKTAWTSDYKYMPDDSSFVFSLKNASSSEPYVIKCTDNKYAIYGGKNYGPCFGYSTGLYIWNWSNLMAIGQSDLNYNYSQVNNKNKSERFLAGEREFFIVKEIEVFQQID